MKYACWVGVHPRQGVKIDGQPTVVCIDQAKDKVPWRPWAGAHQISPARFGGGSPRHDHPAAANADLGSIEIKNRAVGQKSAQPGRAFQGDPGFGIGIGERPIEAVDGRLVQQDVDQRLRASALGTAERTSNRFR